MACVLCFLTNKTTEPVPPVGERAGALCAEHAGLKPAVEAMESLSDGDLAVWVCQSVYARGADRGVTRGDLSLVLRAYGFEEGV